MSGIRRYLLTKQITLNVFQLRIEYRDPLESFKNRKLLRAAGRWLKMVTHIFDYILLSVPIHRPCFQPIRISATANCLSLSLLCPSPSHISPPPLHFPSLHSLLHPHSLFDSFIVPIVQSACEFITGSRWTLGPQDLHIGNLRQAICWGPLSFHLFLSASILCSCVPSTAPSLSLSKSHISKHISMALNPRINLPPLLFKVFRSWRRNGIFNKFITVYV